MARLKERDVREYDVICIGTGEIGRPIYELLNGVYKTLPIDPIHYPDNAGIDARCEFLHICFPGDLDNFDQLVANYARKYKAFYILIHATVSPGMTRKINKLLGRTAAVSAPVHGKHQNNQMKKDMLRYPKYLGFMDMSPNQVDYVKEHLENGGFSDVRIVYGPENTEWLKVLSTTYFGLIIAWHQEIERICDEFGLDMENVIDIFKYQEDTISPHYSGIIGGHCVMPNIKVIKEIWPSELLDWIEWSNFKKGERENG